MSGGGGGEWQPTLVLALGKGWSFEAFRFKGHPLPILAWPLPELHKNYNPIRIRLVPHYNETKKAEINLIYVSLDRIYVCASGARSHASD